MKNIKLGKPEKFDPDFGESIEIPVHIKNTHVGTLEVRLMDDQERHGTDENEWLVLWHKARKNSEDPIIIDQGNIK